jgi:hypothetical protein
VLEQIILPAVRTNGATDDETGIADLIARRAATEPAAAAKALQLLVVGDRWHALPHIAPLELRQALEILTGSIDAAAREISQSVLHTLGALGFHDYRDLILETEFD